MNLRKVLIAAVLSITPVLPQSLPVVRPPDYDALRQFLVLTDAQGNALKSLQTTRQNAERVIYEQISSRQTHINNLLEAGSNDAPTLGRLMVEVNNLRKQIPASGAAYRAPALNVLNDAQKTRLAQLSQALELQRTAAQAVSLNLIDYPNVPTPRILPAQLEEASVNVDSGH